jgi:hypothetical protein
MQNRTVEVKCRLNRGEADALNKRVKKSGLSRESYLRHLISGLVPTDAPPPDYHAMTGELRAIGRNMNQIALKAHTLNVIDAGRYNEAFTLLQQTLVEIVRAVTLPRKIERKRE